MKATLFLRIAAVLTLLHAILHTVGGVFGKPAPGVAAMVAATMKANRFPVMGAMRSYADLYLGMGLGISISLTVMAVVFWQMGDLARSGAAGLRPMLAVFGIGYLAFAVNSYLHFFYGPVVAEVLIAACLGCAMAAARPSAARTAVRRA